MRDRADKLLANQKIFESRKKAQVAIEKGLVQHCRAGVGTLVRKVSDEIDWQPEDSWQIAPDPEFAYVSRAGAKLAGALAEFQLSVTNQLFLDVGLSTGGFADCLLQNGAAGVVGLDVGTGQLHARLRSEEKLLSIEQYNAREPLGPEPLGLIRERFGRDDFDGLVCDVSFISVLLVLPAQWTRVRRGGLLLILCKPQFEAGAEHLNKKGVVDEGEGLRVLQKTVKRLEDQGLQIIATTQSALRGEDGNQEYFIFARR